MRRWSGVRNYGHPVILDGMVEKIDRFSAIQNEMGWEKSEDRVRDRILSALKVPPYIIGAQMPGSYAAANVTEKVFFDQVNVFLDLLGNVLTNFIGGMEGNEDLLIWWEKCASVNPIVEEKKWSEARKVGDVTRNENRARIGLPPSEVERAERSKLLESVGGMTGTIVVLEKVGQGTLSRESAVATLVEFLEIPQDRAELIVGKASEEETLEEAVQVLEAAVMSLRPQEVAGYLVDRSK